MFFFKVYNRNGICFVLLTVIFVECSEQRNYFGHNVVRISPRNEQEVTVLMHQFREKWNLDVWKEPSCSTCHIDVMLSPFEYDDVISVLKQDGVNVTVLVSDVQVLMDTQKRRKREISSGQFDYSKYHDLEEIHNWLDQIAKQHKGIASIAEVARSYEGRMLRALKISTNSSNDNPAFWIQGGIHAREWISPATMMYIAGQMLENYKKDPTITKMMDQFEWYILPVTNPDGYAYTWEKDRLWRKSRSKTNTSDCVGVDLNRNWKVNWDGSTDSPCSNNYRGAMPFSEVEMKDLANFLRRIKNLKGYIDFHSYSQRWMSPWAYTYNEPTQFKAQDEGSKIAVDALREVYGTRFEHGTAAETIYTASGTAFDWVYNQGVEFSYAVELRDTGRYGFLLPEDQIVPTGKETLTGLVALANYVYQN